MIRGALLFAAVVVSALLWVPVMTAGAFNGAALLCVVLWSLVLWAFSCNPDGCDE